MRTYTAARVILALVALVAMLHRLVPDAGPVLGTVAASGIAIGIFYLTADDEQEGQ